MIVCPKCKAEGNYYYDGLFIECCACGHREWAGTDKNGHLEHLWEKWNKEEK